jgi:hypothetical protein
MNLRKPIALVLFVLGAGLVGVGYGLAQTRSLENKHVLISIPCYSDAVTVAALLEAQYGEIPLGQSLSNMNWIDEGKPKEMVGTGIMFANPKTKTYSNVLIFKDGSACVLNTGIDFKPVTKTDYN